MDGWYHKYRIVKNIRVEDRDTKLVELGFYFLIDNLCFEQLFPEREYNLN